MNNQKANSKKRGFTLVELSIVLVIIGLLIGGILVAQSMIGTAKVQSTVRQLGQFDAAVANFYTKFNQIPGDSSVMGTTTSAAYNNNNLITDYAGSGCTAATLFGGEIAKFWSDLSTSGLKPTGAAQQYTDQSAGTATVLAGSLVNTYIPLVPIGTSVGVLACGQSTQANYYKISQFSVASSAVVALPTASLKPADALAIDTKIDDGNATTGTVLADDNVSLKSATSGLVGTTCTTAAGVYQAGTNLTLCNVMIRMGAQTGNLQ